MTWDWGLLFYPVNHFQQRALPPWGPKPVSKTSSLPSLLFYKDDFNVNVYCFDVLQHCFYLVVRWVASINQSSINPLWKAKRVGEIPSLVAEYFLILPVEIL